MPNPMPPADRKHGSGDRNENDVAELDQQQQTARDKKKEQGREEVEQQSHQDMGVEHS